MAEVYTFHPARRAGLIFQVGVAAVLAGVAVLGLMQASAAEGGVAFLIYLLVGLAAAALVPLFLYRAYALRGATYTLERGGIRLQWGLRAEDIPMTAIQWMYPAKELDHPLSLPWPHWPGALLGTRRLPDHTPIEFLASDTEQLLIIGVAGHCFAISPANPEIFLRAYRSFTELGAIQSLAARSVQPTIVLSNFWTDRLGRALLLSALGLNLVLLIWVGLSIPGHGRIPFRFGPTGLPAEYAPAVRLLLLPTLNGLAFAVDFLLGLFFYRRPEGRIAAYVLWGAGVVTALLFLGAVYFILQTA